MLGVGSKRSLAMISSLGPQSASAMWHFEPSCPQVHAHLFQKQELDLSNNTPAWQFHQFRTRSKNKPVRFTQWVRQGEYLTLDPFMDKVINVIMKKGRKNLAYRLLRDTCNILQRIYPDVPTGEIIRKALDNVKPIVEVRKTRLAGQTRHIPLAIPARRQTNIAIRWILKAARDRKWNVKNSFAECLAVELIDAYQDKGTVKKRRAELHRLAEGGRSMIRRRWWKKTIEFKTA
eukprot:TRINITY_DN245_c0_g2_i1.p2 TRINITY_DN245_c0_g2~~TRINITY_DN245_c0_g2_i1.p2  ORF type:complete len:233 (+),score=16.04 TRINITY_DN245_c0_g2_i1:194-892(+)